MKTLAFLLLQKMPRGTLTVSLPQKKLVFVFKLSQQIQIQKYIHVYEP